MKKIFYLIAAGVLTCSVVACQDEPSNPGDYSVQSQLSLSDIYSLTNDAVYPIEIARTVDTVFYTWKVTKRDTTFDPATGEVLDIKNDTLFTPTHYCKFYEAAPIMLPMPADTFRIDITSNARWLSPVPAKPRGSSAIYNDATTSGGGSSYLVFYTDPNENATRKVSADMFIYTSDSTVMYKLPFLQAGID